ncbi:hypothetical protein Tcan_00407, partial [Toxocara canis]
PTLRSFERERSRRVRSRLVLRPPRRFGDGERRFGDGELRRLLGDGDTFRLGDAGERRFGDRGDRRLGDGEARRRGEGELRRLGDGVERRRRRSGVGERREDAMVAFSPRSARTAPCGERERLTGLRPRS